MDTTARLFWIYSLRGGMECYWTGSDWTPDWNLTAFYHYADGVRQQTLAGRTLGPGSLTVLARLD
jgi:hypothetical protein